jgi:superfamily II DNA or RNA helicase
MNRYKKSSGPKYKWRPASNPSQPVGKQPQPVGKSQQPLCKEDPKPQTPAPITSLNTYLGPRGYTICKSDLSEERIVRLRQELTVRPAAGAVGYGAPSDAVEYPIYRESPNKFYVPRFFGEREFGPVKKLGISGGEDIDVPFAGSLRPIQIPVVAAYMKAVGAPMLGATDTGGGGLLELPCAFGKTVLSLKIIAELRKKTLVIVNKEFLLNQWVERIGQFLPTARVGRIQGPEIDIADKDIVIGMLQSISMKDYDPKVFESFGLTIIDEVHHISSEVFSRALFKIVSKYMLGLSATMERKDGTTYVFKQFLGEVVFKGERDEEHDVEVRAIEFVSKDAEFNAVEYDFRGNPKYSTMIVKLCDYAERSDFIVHIVADLVKEQPGAQIMILAHNRSILTYLHDSIQDKRIATAGYYVGGMKEASLKATEDKQVVVATYAMAAEALDIKTLNTLVMVTPKTDIVQSVGRILREKHDKPLVIDIVDKHDVFQNQWTKRRRYYKKCGYTIKAIDSTKYEGFSDMTKWKLVYKNAASNYTNRPQCVKEHSDSEDDEHADATKPIGLKKCMVLMDHLEEES